MKYNTTTPNLQADKQACTGGAFYQLPEAIARSRDLTPATKIVYAIAADMKRRGREPSLQRLIDASGSNRMTVVRSLKQLRNAGLLATHSNGNGRRSTYTISPATSLKMLPVPKRDRSQIDTQTSLEMVPEPVPNRDRITEHNTENNNNLPACAGGAQSQPSRRRADRTAAPADPRVAAIVNYYSQRFEAERGHKPTIRGGRDGAAIKALVAKHGPELVRSCIDNMLADAWGRSRATIGLLSSQWDTWLSGATAGAGSGGQRRAAKRDREYAAMPTEVPEL